MDLLDGKPSAALLSIAMIVPVRNVQRAIVFYERLGFEAELYQGDNGTGSAAEYAFLSRDGQQVHLRRAPDLDGQGGENPAGMYLYVSDVDAIYEELQAADVKCLGEPEDKPWGMREFAVSDPDGALLRFGQRAVGTVGG